MDFFFWGGGGFEIRYVAIRIKVRVGVHRRDGLVVRASASRSGGCGFEPRPSHTKDFTMVPIYCLLVRRSAFKNGEGKLNSVATRGLTPYCSFSLHSANLWPRVIETEIGAALCAMFGAGRTLSNFN